MKTIRPLLVAIVLLAGSCQETADVTPKTPAVALESEIASRPNSNAKISPYVDIDQQDLLLQYKNTQGVVQDVIPPWGSAVAVYADDNIRFDHFTRDGWEIIYNTFDITQTNSRPCLVLYNKFRGVLRWWWYNDQVPAGPSNYLTYALMIDGNNTSMFNFSTEFATIYSSLKTRPFVVTSNTSAWNQGLLNQAWYYFDTEFAYDPNVKNKPQGNYSLALNAWATSQAKLTATGDINGTIRGTIETSGTGASLFNNLIGSITQNSYTSSIIRTDNGDKTKVSFEDKVNTAISSGLADAIKSNLNKLASQGLQILSSPLSNIFNSIISSSIDPKQKVELKLAAKLQINGTIGTEQPAYIFKGAVPGTARGDLSGYVPYYNEPLGAFNLSSPPVVRWRKVNILPYPPPTSPVTSVQYLVDNTAQVVINPAIADSVTISPISTTLIYMRRYSGKEPMDLRWFDPATWKGMTPVNSVHGNEWYAFSAPYTLYYQDWPGTPEKNIVVRVSFTITPKNGSAPIEVSRFYRPQFVAI